MDPLSSDHLPLTMTITMVFSADTGCPTPVIKCNFELADWGRFRSVLWSAVIDVDQADLEDVNSQIVSSILEAVRVAIPTTSRGAARPLSNPWWNKDCQEAVRLKRKMCKRYSKKITSETHEQLKSANKDCNKIIAQAKKTYWLAFSEFISANKSDLGFVWKRMKKKFDLHRGSQVSTTDQAKADAFVEAFSEASDPERLHTDMRQFRRERETNFSDPSPGEGLTVSSPSTCSELKRALGSIQVFFEDSAGLLPEMLG